MFTLKPILRTVFALVITSIVTVLFTSAAFAQASKVVASNSDLRLDASRPVKYAKELQAAAARYANLRQTLSVTGATVTTDKPDYQPGDTVTITGTGWTPGETVALEIVSGSFIWNSTAIADGNGEITNNEYVVRQEDLHMTLYLTATGQTSGQVAMATFTDATITVTANTNWSALTGGGGPGGLPNSSDAVIVQNGATLTVNVTGAVCNTLTLGVRASGDGTLTFASSGSPDLTVSGAVTLAATSGSGSQATGTLTMVSGATLTCGSLVTGTGTAVYNTNAGTVALTGTFTLPTGATTFNNLTISSGTTTLSAILTINGSLTIASGATLDASASNFNISVAADWTNNGGTFTPRSATVTFNSTTAAQAINGSAASQTFNAITVSKSGQTLSVGGSTTTLTLNGVMTLSAGTFDAGTASAINIAGNWTSNGGSFTSGSGTVTFTGSSAAINGTAASQTFNHIIVNKTAGQTLSVSGSTTTLTVNNLTETQGNFTAPATLNINGALTLTAGTFTAGTNTNIAGDWTNNAAAANFAPGSGTVTFTSTSGAQAINGSAATQTFNSITLNKSGQTLSVGGSTTTLTLNGNFTLTAGTFDAGTATAINVAGNSL